MASSSDREPAEHKNKEREYVSSLKLEEPLAKTSQSEESNGRKKVKEEAEKQEGEEEGLESENESSFHHNRNDIDSVSPANQSSSEFDYGNYMATDSEEEFKDVVRTLRHYRRRRRRRGSSDSRSVDSNCSCTSCASDAKCHHSFFGSQEGPPGGEITSYRRAALWLGRHNFVLGLLFYGMLFVGAMIIAVASYAYYRNGHLAAGISLLKSGIPLAVISFLVIIIWQVIRCFLICKGYQKGDLVDSRRQVIDDAQKKELIYTVRGAIYAPVEKNLEHPKRHVYKVVGHEEEYDSEGYFDSDLEADGQYRTDITPWRDIEDPYFKDKRNIYTRKAWFRDVPIVWWELDTQPQREF